MTAPENLIPQFARERVKQARDFALLAHGEQKYGDQPYIIHLDAVAAIVAENEKDPDSFEASQRIAIALLHDGIEDTEVTAKQLERAFGPHVARQVSLVSDAEGPNRKSRKATTNDVLSHLGPSDYDALIVKAADRLANIRSAVTNQDNPRSPASRLLKMYRNEHKAFWEAARRIGLVDPIWDELNALLNEEGKNGGVAVS